MLRDACIRYGPSIVGLTHEGLAVDGARLLWAISGCESAFGKQREFVRAEPAYQPGGRYFAAPHLTTLYRRWGVLASSSFGSFQLLYVTATELGFTSHPIALQDDMICAQWATDLIRRRFVQTQGAKTLRDVLDAYNSGAAKDGIVPAAYIAKGIGFYDAGLPDA